ncbi:hypothetical protein U9M48_013892 [Paspalum notatum var. saurae]|uniref:Myb-like domain-containing protein n=1 Tax=Paspalum notatum var. saurae TaxID=547442 RepID=A0AAQ3T0V5_PASNO
MPRQSSTTCGSSEAGTAGAGGGDDIAAGEEGDDPNGDDRNGNDDEEERVGGRRLAWTEQDNMRLLSAWLNNSIDPIDGNCKKGEVYWKQVANEYNDNSPVDRRRKAANCKDHWGKTNRKLVHFNGIWCRLKAAYASGRSDDQLMDEAHQVYRSETSKCFTLVYLWRVVHNQPKWTRTYVEEGSNSSEASQRVEGETRPPGQKQAKSKLKGKAESSLVNLCHDDIQLYHDTQALRASTADKMAEVQLQISRDKVEAARHERELHKQIIKKHSWTILAKCDPMPPSTSDSSDEDNNSDEDRIATTTPPPPPPSRRYNIKRDREDAYRRLVAKYFSDNPDYTDAMFRRRYRMKRPLFLRIVEALGRKKQMPWKRKDSPLVKCTMAMRMLAYACPADSLDETLDIGASTVIECVKKFVRGVIKTQPKTFNDN